MRTSSQDYSAVIFDLDGVLIDSEPIHLRAVDLLLRKRNIHLTPEQAAMQTGITFHVFLRKIVEDCGIPGPRPGENWVEEKRAIFRELAEKELQTVAGATALLRALHGKARLAVATSSSRRYLNWMIDRFGWHGLFDAVCTIDDVRHPKPDPEIYRLTLDRLGVNGRPVIVFEDSPAGIEAVRRVGLDCCALATSFAPERLLANGAKWVIRDFEDRENLCAILGDLVNSHEPADSRPPAPGRDL
jgi:HAD superfamily hydrolase (TIGR01509 family)